MTQSVSVIVSALNEEKNLRQSVHNARALFGQYAKEYELLIFDDGSTDATGRIADELAKEFPLDIKVVHHPVNKGLAQIAREGIEQAAKHYITWFPGDNSIQKESMIPLLKVMGHDEIIVATMVNQKERSWKRRMFSTTFVGTLNTLFGLKIRYYNGPSLYPAATLKSLKIKSEGFGLFAEMMVRALKSGCRYREVPFTHNVVTDRESKSLTWKTVKNIAATLRILWNDIYIHKKPLG